MTLGKLAFRFGRRIGKHPAAGWLFCITERLLPLQRLARHDGLVAFHHPRPIDEPHVLIVPTRPVSSLTTDRFTGREMSKLIWSMIELAGELAAQVDAIESWQLVINGGTRQDIGQLHGHLLGSTKEPDNTLLELTEPEKDFDAWIDILGALKEANNVPENGYSLNIQQHSGYGIRAKVT